LVPKNGVEEEWDMNEIGMGIRGNGLGMKKKLCLVGGYERVIHWEWEK